MRYFGAPLHPFDVVRQQFAQSVASDPTSLCKISSQSVPVCDSYSRWYLNSDVTRTKKAN